MEVYLFTFETISMVLLFEKTLQREKIKTKLMPVPRQFSSSCGNCAIIEKEDLEKVKELCKKNHIYYDEIHVYKQ
ncbi:MAG: DUF3343 domain-containing protein [Gallicola sp.]|uniref:DUF3343 domain-containing protein n=1 Tax=Gallicola sp. Sow4_E12 TaxID=3438785 RepID=UPI0018513898|nr:DUF3343 domain-containing protein [Gallicola sp.]